MADFSVVASEIESIARHLRLAGDGELVRSLQKAMSNAVAPVKDDIRGNLIPALPNPYAATLDADLTLRTSTLTGTSPRVRVTGTTSSAKRRRLRRLNSGILEHPLYGNRNHWYRQPVQPGWFTAPAERDAPRVREEILRALDDVASKAASKGA